MAGLIAALIIGVAIGLLSERMRYTRMGARAAVLTATGGAVLGYMVLLLFGIELFGRGVMALIGAVAALYFSPGARLR